MEKYEEAIELLKKYKQAKVLSVLEKSKNKELIEQILKIDFEQVEECKEKIRKEEKYENEKIESISYVDTNKLTVEEKEHYENIGSKIIEKGSYAVVTMAGGQRNKVRSFWSKRNFYNECRSKA